MGGVDQYIEDNLPQFIFARHLIEGRDIIKIGLVR